MAAPTATTSSGFTPLDGFLPKNFSTSAQLGKGMFFVIEADEYDSAFFDKRSKFIHYKPKTLIMNNLEFELLNGYLDQLSFKTQNTINELQLVKRHIDRFKSQITKRDISEQTRAKIPEQKMSIEQTQIRDKQSSDLIKIK